MERGTILDTGKIWFELQGIGEIRLWTEQQPAPVVKRVAEFQQVLRRCNAADEGTIRLFSEAMISSPAITVQNFASVVQHLGL